MVKNGGTEGLNARSSSDGYTPTSDGDKSIPPKGWSKPEVTIHRNGYEIRTDVLKYAKDFVETNYHFKFNEWQASAETDKDGKTIYKVEFPQSPTIETILETAKRFYDFVNAR
jgi:hypothetical protein